MRRKASQGTIFEFMSVGRFVKVSAVDTQTGFEVSIVGDPAAGEVALRQLAARKLKNMMARRAAGRAPGQSGWNDLA
ncbi:MAG: hypothetical protein VX612_10235 [Pseudomonadota bacterium]|nr:hypothetical protein [Pseudomonadota bacterium]MEC8117240.1 hypothetical protein [Pseudomonadota bacterium]MEC8281994.1 hypothetical protein [Pseudomonadota bacterium]MEC8317925.1 hypothetical protein [Pseudomonadota bacterium]MEC8674913.1 hypothetical protein [Pseudomonadota bacterium]